MTLLASNTIELIWMAGFLEGEGCFDIHTSGSTPRVRAAQNDLEPLERLRREWGGKVYKQNRGWSWELIGRSAADVMRELRPHMTQRRQIAIDAALATHDAIQDKKAQRRVVCRNGHKVGPANIYTDPSGRDHCRRCRLDSARRSREKRARNR